MVLERSPSARARFGAGGALPEPYRLNFRDPRGPAVAMYETPGIDLPWVGSGTGIPFAPAAGHLLLFPSWLEHRVEPFEGSGERISLAFNVCNPPAAKDDKVTR